MKKIAIALLALVVVACADNTKEGNLQISGNIKGLHKGTVYIQRLEDTTFVMLDSIPISGSSKFESTLNIDSPQMLYMFLDRGTTNSIDDNLMFFAEPGKITIDTNHETFYAQAKITGSKNHDLYEEYKKGKARFTNQELTLTEQDLNALKENKPAPTDQDEKYSAIIKRKYLHAINFALNHKDHEIAPYIALSEINDANVKYLDTIRVSMTPQVANSKYGKMLTKYVAEKKQQ